MLTSSARNGHNTEIIRTFFNKLSDAKLTIKLAKSVFCHENLTFLGHILGLGQVKPFKAEVFLDFPVPTEKTTNVMCFLSMAWYYRNSVIAEPLTNLLGKRVKYVWRDVSNDKSFVKLKAILKSAPVLLAPSFYKEF